MKTTMMKLLCAALLVLAASATFAQNQQTGPGVALGYAVSTTAKTYADEATDWGISPTSELTRMYHAKTPTTVPGAKTVTTIELKTMLDGLNPPIVFDVLGGDMTKRRVIRGAFLLGGAAGDGDIYAVEKARFAKMLDATTGGNKDKPMVFYCLDSHCWLSYNAALRAIGEGYHNVFWYRGGINAWKAAGHLFHRTSPYPW